MGALSLALPFSAFLYLLPSSVPNISSNLGKVATTVADQLSDIVGVIDVPKEINGKVVLEQNYANGGSLYPLGIIKPIVASANDATKVNVDFQAKVESKKHPDHGISTNVQLAKQAEWSRNVPLNEHKELSVEEERIKDLTRTLRNGNAKDANVLHLYVPDITDTLIEKFAKPREQLGLDVVSRDVDKKNHANKRRNSYIRLCRRSIDGSSLMQKLRGKDCVKLPRNEFYLEQDTKDVNQKEGNPTIRLVGLQIGAKTNNGKDYRESESESDEFLDKQQSGATEATPIEASISDGSVNYEQLSPAKIVDRLGMGLNIKKPIIDGKIALSSTSIKM